MWQVILQTTHSLKQCRTITHSFFFFEKQTHTQERRKEFLKIICYAQIYTKKKKLKIEHLIDYKVINF